MTKFMKLTNFLKLEKEKSFKKTVFEKAVSVRGDVQNPRNSSVSYKNVLHIGYDRRYGDVFKCWDDDVNDFLIYFGEKGDEDYESI